MPSDNEAWSRSFVAWLFPGQGSQTVGMGRELYRHERVFRETVDACCDILQAILGLDLRDIIFASDDSAAEAAEKLKASEPQLSSPPAIIEKLQALEARLESGGPH